MLLSMSHTHLRFKEGKVIVPAVLISGKGDSRYMNQKALMCRTVFDTLYLLLSFGHQSLEDSQKYDPPTNYFRIRLVCVLLSTCGQYFSKGSAGARLDRFLTYFQRYLLYKPPLPLDIEFDVQVWFT